MTKKILSVLDPYSMRFSKMLTYEAKVLKFVITEQIKQGNVENQAKNWYK